MTVEPVIRLAQPADVDAIVEFGVAHIPAHYAPLIGPAAAASQVSSWWNVEQISTAAANGLLVVAEHGDAIVGVAQRGRRGEDHVLYKLYLHPDYRGHGLGRRLLAAVEQQLPDDADALLVEHFAANERAGAFYRREGFTVARIEPSPSGNPASAVVWRRRGRIGRL